VLQILAELYSTKVRNVSQMPPAALATRLTMVKRYAMEPLLQVLAAAQMLKKTRAETRGSVPLSNSFQDKEATNG